MLKKMKQTRKQREKQMAFKTRKYVQLHTIREM